MNVRLRILPASLEAAHLATNRQPQPWLPVFIEEEHFLVTIAYFRLRR